MPDCGSRPERAEIKEKHQVIKRQRADKVIVRLKGTAESVCSQ